MRVLLAAIYLSVVLAACGSDPQHLDRGRAKTLLAQAYAASDFALFFSPATPSPDLRSSLPRGYDADDVSFQQEQVLMRAGYLRVMWRCRRPDGGQPFCVNEYLLTAKGKAAIEAHGLRRTELVGQYDADIATARLGPVTGIRFNGNTALVDYSYVWVPNTLGRELLAVGLNPRSPNHTSYDDPLNTLVAKTASFVRYDDGWRLTKLDVNQE